MNAPHICTHMCACIHAYNQSDTGCYESRYLELCVCLTERLNFTVCKHACITYLLRQLLLQWCLWYCELRQLLPDPAKIWQGQRTRKGGEQESCWIYNLYTQDEVLKIHYNFSKAPPVFLFFSLKRKKDLFSLQDSSLIWTSYLVMCVCLCLCMHLNTQDWLDWVMTVPVATSDMCTHKHTSRARWDWRISVSLSQTWHISSSTHTHTHILGFPCHELCHNEHTHTQTNSHRNKQGWA